MTGFFIIIHTIMCILLVGVILMQSGRGGGLTEGFASAESMFGAQTNVFLIKATTIFASIFLVTCLSLAFFSVKKNESLMSNVTSTQTEAQLFDEPIVPMPLSEDNNNF